MAFLAFKFTLLWSPLSTKQPEVRNNRCIWYNRDGRNDRAGALFLNGRFPPKARFLYTACLLQA